MMNLMAKSTEVSSKARAVVDDRAVVLAAAHAARPERFVRGVPKPAALPTAVWINKATSTSAAPSATSAGQPDDQPAPAPAAPPDAVREDRIARPPTADHPPPRVRAGHADPREDAPLN